MLKEEEMKRLNLQLGWIYKKLEKAENKGLGGTIVTGFLYEEAIEELKQNGYKVKAVKSEKLLTKNDGYPSYAIYKTSVKETPEGSVNLEEEKNAVEKIEELHFEFFD